MDAVEKALGHHEGPWFMQQYGLVDVTFVPFLERIVASIPYYKVLFSLHAMGISIHGGCSHWVSLLGTSVIVCLLYLSWPCRLWLTSVMACKCVPLYAGRA